MKKFLMLSLACLALLALIAAPTFACGGDKETTTSASTTTANTDGKLASNNSSRFAAGPAHVSTRTRKLPGVPWANFA
jgi:hypothetical protein